MRGTHYVSRRRLALSVVALVATIAAVLAVTPSAGALSASGRVSEVTVSRDDGTLTAAWSAPEDATHYHITYTTDNAASWKLAAYDHTETTITIDDADNTKTYIIGVRAYNTTGTSHWTNSAPAGPFAPAPARVSEVTTTRDDGTLTAAWNAPEHATHYHVTYTIDNAASWKLAAYDHTETTITIDDADNTKTYIIGVRAYNTTGTSHWTNSAPAGPHTPPVPAPGSVSKVTLTRADGTVTAAWNAPAHATRYHITYTTDNAQSWNLAAFAHTETTITIDGAANDDTYIVGVRAYNTTGTSLWANSAPAGPHTPAPPTGLSTNPGGGITPSQSPEAALTASSITKTSATLLRAGFTGNWHYQANRGPHDSCSGAVSGSSVDLAGLSVATHYVYTAYSDALCSTPLASEEFTTLPTYALNPALTPTRGTLTHSGVTLTPDPWSSDWYYKSDKAPHNSGCLGPVAGGGPLRVTGLRASTSYTYTMYDDPPDTSYDHPGCEVNIAEVSFTTTALPELGIDISTLVGHRLTLAPAGWNSAWYYQKHKDGSPEGACTGPVGPGSVSVSTVLQADSSYTYKVYAYADCASSSEIASRAFSVPELASAPSTHTARLTLNDWPAPWWYRRLGVFGASGDLAGYGHACQGPFFGAATAVAGGLESGETYAFQAYSSWAACRNDPKNSSRLLSEGILGPLARVTTVANAGLALSDVTATGATLTISGYSGDWFVKQTAPAAGPCSSAISGTAHRLTSLVEGRTHTYAAYNDPNCTTRLATAAFTTLSLAANSVAATTATLTLTGHSGDWHYKADTGPHNTCQGPVSTNTAALNGLTAGTTYNYTAYRDSGCANADELAPETVTALSLAATDIASMGAVLTLAGSHTGDWYYKADIGPHSTCQGSVSTAATALGGLSPNTSYTYTAYRDSGCANTLASASAFTTLAALTATDITPTSATLAIGGHSGQWWYKANTGPDNSCKGPVSASTATKALSGLTERTSYTYSAYSQSGCTNANLLATARTFNTGGVSVGNVGNTVAGDRLVGYIRQTGNNRMQSYATSFTTGSDASYTLNSVQVRFGSGPDSAYNVHAYVYTDSSGKPSGSRVDIGGAKPGFNAWQWFRCSHANCALDGSKTYWLVLRHNNNFSDLDTLAYRWKYTNSTSETNNPTNAGWSIGDVSYRGARPATTINWDSNSVTGAGMFKLVVQLTAGLDASDISAGSATLKLSDYDGVWWYERTSPSGDDTCYRVDSGDATRLSGLTASTSYTYKAYDNPDCASGNELASQTFSTTTASAPSLAASSITATAATLTLSEQAGAWYYLADTGPDSTCQGPVSAGTSTEALSGLTAGTTYTYGAYSDSGCSALLAEETFTALSLTAANVANTTATLTLGGSHGGPWYYQHTSPTGGACSAAVTGTSATVANLSPGAAYTFAAYRDSGCANALATAAAFSTDGLTASTVAATGATLTINGHTGTWYLKQTAPTTGACSSAISGTTHDVSSLTPRTVYGYTAYSDSGCATAVTSGTFTTLGPTLTAVSVTASAATLTIDGHTTAWWYKGNQSNAACVSVGAGTGTASVTGLTPGTAYAYTAYSNSACSAMIAATPAFTTLSLSAHDIADTTATLRLPNRTGHWYYKADIGPHATCQGPISGPAAALTGLTGRGTYTYRSYSDAACTSANLLATAAAFTTHRATLTYTSDTTATLTIAGHSGNWWYLADTAPYTACYRAGSGTVSLTRLTPNTTYTFTIHSERGCGIDEVLATAR